MNKREFVRTAGGAAAAMAFGPDLQSLFARYAHVGAAALAEDEKFWGQIRSKFKLTKEWTNLENGYYCDIIHPSKL